MLDELQRPSMREWPSIFDGQQETVDAINDSIEKLRAILNKNQARNKRALSWVREVETNISDLLQSLRIMKNRVLRLQIELDHLPIIDESAEDSEEEV